MSRYEMVYPDWLRSMTRGKESIFRRDEPISAGISGGRTSGLMRFLCREHGSEPMYCGFRNTGREHSQTYLFLQRMDVADMGLEWTEFRKPTAYGAPPSMAGFAVVDAATCSRKGEPFLAFLETLAEYRTEVKGIGPISPYANMRLCSAYMKHKVSAKVMESKGWDCYTFFVGLRADEQRRVAKMTLRDTRTKTTAAPLAELGITKEHVNRFWREQSFNLELTENLGNCTLCFLKDYGDLAHNMLTDCRDEVGWWIGIEKRFGSFFAGATSYERIYREAPFRESIREGIESGLIPMRPAEVGEREWKLLVRQEQARRAKGLYRVACNCEAAELLTDEFIEQIKVAL